MEEIDNSNTDVPGAEENIPAPKKRINPNSDQPRSNKGKFSNRNPRRSLDYSGTTYTEMKQVAAWRIRRGHSKNFEHFVLQMFEYSTTDQYLYGDFKNNRKK